MPNTPMDAVPMLLDWAVRGLFLLGAAGGAALLLRRSSSALRHLAWTLGLAGVLAVPVLRPVVPGLAVPVPDWTPVRVAPAAAVAPHAASGEAGPAAPAAVGLDARSVTGEATLEGTPALRSAAGSGSSSIRPVAGAAAGDPGPADPDPAPADRGMGGWLVALWLAGVAACLLPLVAGRLGLVRLSRRLDRFGDPRVRSMATRVELRVGLRRRYRLLEGPTGSMPMTFGALRPAIVLPGEAREWSDGRLEAVLVHELAHVARRDTATQLLAEVVRALHWFDPLAWLAARRLRIEREHACDDLALATGSRPSEYADELLGLARSYRAGVTAAALAMARPGDVPGRLRAILDGSRRRGRVAGAPALFGITAAAVAIVVSAGAGPARAAVSPTEPAAPTPGAAAVESAPDARATPAASLEAPASLPAVASRPAAEAQGPETCLAAGDSWNRIQNQSRNGRRSIRMERRGCDFELRLEGEMDFDAYEMRIVSMSPGARLTIEEDSRAADRSLEVRAGRDGALAFAYELDGDDHPFDAAARAWFASALQEIFRSTGFLADERVEALLREGGVDAVFAELGRLRSSHVFAAYAEALLEQAELDEAALRALVRSAAGKVDSDHYLGGILEAVAGHQPLLGGLMDDYLTATMALESDHYRTAALRAAIDSGRLTGAQVEATLRAAGTMDSDHYRTEVLVNVADRYALEPAFRPAYLEATASMDSDHYRAEVLGRLLERGDIDAAEKAEVLRATAMLESDHYRSTLLARVAGTGLSEPALHRAYFEVAADLDSDHYYRESLDMLLGQGVDDALLVEILQSATRELESDHYLSELLLTVLGDYTVQGDVRTAFLDAMDALDSDHYRGRVADALLRADRP